MMRSSSQDRGNIDLSNKAPLHIRDTSDEPKAVTHKYSHNAFIAQINFSK